MARQKRKARFEHSGKPPASHQRSTTLSSDTRPDQGEQRASQSVDDHAVSSSSHIVPPSQIQQLHDGGDVEQHPASERPDDELQSSINLGNDTLGVGSDAEMSDGLFVPEDTGIRNTRDVSKSSRATDANDAANSGSAPGPSKRPSGVKKASKSQKRRRQRQVRNDMNEIKPIHPRTAIPKEKPNSAVTIPAWMKQTKSFSSFQAYTYSQNGTSYGSFDDVTATRDVASLNFHTRDVEKGGEDEGLLKTDADVTAFGKEIYEVMTDCSHVIGSDNNQVLGFLDGTIYPAGHVKYAALEVAKMVKRYHEEGISYPRDLHPYYHWRRFAPVVSKVKRKVEYRNEGDDTCKVRRQSILDALRFNKTMVVDILNQKHEEIVLAPMTIFRYKMHVKESNDKRKGKANKGKGKEKEKEDSEQSFAGNEEPGEPEAEE